MCPINNLLNHRISLTITVFLFIFPLLAFGQYYPMPKPEDPANEQTLLKQLASVSGKDKIKIFLRLSNLYLNKPLRRNADMKRAMAYGIAARDSSIKYNDKKSTNEAQLLIADIFTFQDNMLAAESILPELKDTAKAALYLNLSYKYGLTEQTAPNDEWVKGLAFAERARRLSIQLNLPLYEILALEDAAYIHMLQSKGDPEKEYFEVLKRYRALKYPYLQYIFERLAVYYHYTGHPDKAEYYSEEAIKTMQATKDTLIAGDIYSVYSSILYNNDNYQKAFDFANLAIEHLKIHAGWYCATDRNILVLPVYALRRLKKYPQAIQYAKRIQSEYPADNPADRINDARILGNIYRDMKAYDETEKLFLTALGINKTQPTPDIGLSKDIGQLYVESHQYSKAKPFLNFVFNYKNTVLSSSVKSHLNYLLFLADSATGDYFSAIKHLSLFHNAQEIGLRKDKDENAKKLEVQFETRQKEDSIKLLHQRAALDKGNLQRANLVKNVTIAGSVLVLIIASLLYRQSRLRKKNNRYITHQNKLITQKNEQLQNLVAEKEWLLKEVHHRVKNNLHSVICLLEAQAAYLQNDALQAIENSQHRIYTMSLIHQKLYQSDDVKTIDMSIYIPELVQYMRDSFDNSGQIHFNLNIDPIHLNASQAIPLALIINEALTNAIKYAFPIGRRGEITISLTHNGTGYKLEITDNGIGINKKAVATGKGSLGLELMKGLAKEIRGEITIENNNGVSITIVFDRDLLHSMDQEQVEYLESI